MKQRFLILFGVLFLIIALIGLNAASFVQKEKEPDNEFTPNRSTYNAGATGTRAFFELLAETGRKPVRWQESPSALLTATKNKPNTFVIIGTIRRDFEETEYEQLLRWVSEGGKLVLIDREFPEDLVKTSVNWKVSHIPEVSESVFGVDPSDQNQMTVKINAAKPVQPTVYTMNINAVQPSRFASTLKFERKDENLSNNKISSGNGIGTGNSEPLIVKPSPTPTFNPTPAPQNKSGKKEELYTLPTPKPTALPMLETAEVEENFVEAVAPVVHLSNDKKILLADFPYGGGKIVLLTDPYIISNGGIGLVDNAQIGINIVSAGDGIIAFDEYHHGYGSQNNRLFAYFTGTPVIPIFLQCIALIAVILFSQSRRFARPVPEPEPNRLSKLEYVSAMAELQQRTKGYDLAIENIYTDFRRRVARLVGVDNFATPRSQIAQLIAERLPLENPREIEDLMQQCEAVAQGEPTNKKEVLNLTKRLRELEEKLGLQRRKRSKKAKV